MESRCLAESDPQGGSRPSRQIRRAAALKCGMLSTQGLPTMHLGKYKNTHFTHFYFLRHSGEHYAA